VTSGRPMIANHAEYSNVSPVPAAVGHTHAVAVSRCRKALALAMFLALMIGLAACAPRVASPGPPTVAPVVTADALIATDGAILDGAIVAGDEPEPRNRDDGQR